MVTRRSVLPLGNLKSVWWITVQCALSSAGLARAEDFDLRAPKAGLSRPGPPRRREPFTTENLRGTVYAMLDGK